LSYAVLLKWPSHANSQATSTPTLISQHIPITIYNTPETLILCIIQKCKRAHREVTINFCQKHVTFLYLIL